MKKNTCFFTLIRHRITKEQVVRAEAKSQIGDDLEAGWTVQSVTVNGDEVSK